MNPHHLQPLLSFYLAKVTKIIRFTNPIKPVNYNVYLIVIVHDKILFINRCDLSTVVITFVDVVSLVAVYTVWTVLWV